jgi:hypothetical protein
MLFIFGDKQLLLKAIGMPEVSGKPLTEVRVLFCVIDFLFDGFFH